MDEDYWTPELQKLLQPDKKVRRFFSEGNVNNALLHIRGIVDNGWIVYRVWSRHKRCWRYNIESLYYFRLLLQNGRLSRAK